MTWIRFGCRDCCDKEMLVLYNRLKTVLFWHVSACTCSVKWWSRVVFKPFLTWTLKVVLKVLTWVWDVTITFCCRIYLLVDILWSTVTTLYELTPSFTVYVIHHYVFFRCCKSFWQHLNKPWINDFACPRPAACCVLKFFVRIVLSSHCIHFKGRMMSLVYWSTMILACIGYALVLLWYLPAVILVGQRDGGRATLICLYFTTCATLIAGNSQSIAADWQRQNFSCTYSFLFLPGPLPHP